MLSSFPSTRRRERFRLDHRPRPPTERARLVASWLASEDELIICVAEDRKEFLPSIKLLLLSLAAHCPGVKVYLIFPPALAEFRSWLSQYPQVLLRTEPLPTAYGVNVKPQAILHLFDEGFEE